LYFQKSVNNCFIQHNSVETEVGKYLQMGDVVENI